ncbi:MAG TPA: hypothetical protein VND68_13815 [Chloroflexia bacterium]|nr:hypothetical protein [Chloroflexia bacterium]
MGFARTGRQGCYFQQPGSPGCPQHIARCTVRLVMLRNSNRTFLCRGIGWSRLRMYLLGVPRRFLGEHIGFLLLGSYRM